MQLKTQAFLGLAELIDLALPQIATKLGEQGLKMASQDYTLDYPNGETASAEGFILTFQCVGLAAAKKKAASVAPAQLPAPAPAPAPAEDIKPVAGDKVPMTTAQRIAKMNAARLEKRAEKLATTAEAVVETPTITQVETVETPPPQFTPGRKMRRRCPQLYQTRWQTSGHWAASGFQVMPGLWRPDRAGRQK
jgi:hypothetical protein